MTSDSEGMLAGGLREYSLPAYGAKLIKNSKGYTWEVSARGELWTAVLGDLFDMNERLLEYATKREEATED